MPRQTEAWARPLWAAAMAEHDWESSVLDKVMFDWDPGKATRYHPNPPAFFSIADEDGTVDEQEYIELRDAL